MISPITLEAPSSPAGFSFVLTGFPHSQIARLILNFSMPDAHNLQLPNVGLGEDGLLASAYHSSLDLAKRQGLASIAFPAISTGIYGYPLNRAAGIAVATVCGWLDKEDGLEEVVFCVFGDAAEAAYREALAKRPRAGAGHDRPG